MTTESADAHPPDEPLCQRLHGADDADAIADATVLIWLEIEVALHPIIGPRGVAALYNRSLTLAAVAHPWLTNGHLGGLSAIDPAALKAALAQQDPAEAAEGGCAVFRSFRALLTSLVGASLTDRLLRPVWTHASGASPAQDTSS